MKPGLRLSAVCLLALLLGVGPTNVRPPDARAAQASSTGAETLLAEGAGMGASPRPDVRSVQRRLLGQGLTLGTPGVDGRFGPLTRAAVIRFQRRYGLVADGIAGPSTRRLLRALCEARGCPPRAPTGTGGATQPPTPSAAPSTQSAAHPTTGRADHGIAPIAVVAAALAVLLALGLLVAAGLRRWRDRVTIVPIDYDLEVTGVSLKVGQFAGPAVALAYTHGIDTEEQVEAMYLVSDPEHDGPVWVRLEEISRVKLARQRVLGYVGTPVSLAPGGGGLESQELEIWESCRRRGWELLEVLHEVPGGEREALAYALEQIGRGRASCLVMSSLGRLGSSPEALSELLRWFSRGNGTLVVLDAGIDTSTNQGRRRAEALAATAVGEGDPFDPNGVSTGREEEALG